MVCSKRKTVGIFIFKHPKMTTAGQKPVLLLWSQAADAGIATPYKTSDREFCASLNGVTPEQVQRSRRYHS